MGRKTLFLSIVVCLVIGAAHGAFAHDHFGDWAGGWQRYTPGTTTQAWEFGNGRGPDTHNPYGTAVINIVGGQNIEGLLNFQGPGSVSLHIPNSPIDNPFKLIFIQVTSSKALNGPPIIEAPGTITTKPGPTIYGEGGTFYTYTWVTRIERNPNFEHITLNFYEGTNVEEIVIDTICTVPEPGSMVAMFSGLVGLVGFGIRRRK